MVPIKPLKEAAIYPSRYDMRDNQYTTERALFGSAMTPDALPREGLYRRPISVENQLDTQFCTAGVSNASEYQEKVPLSWAFQVAAISRLKGFPILNGCDPRTALKSAIVYGSLEESFAAMKFPGTDPSVVANWQNWTDEQWGQAEKHRKAHYLWVKGKYDVFDNIRMALWLGKEENQVVMAFGRWYAIWNTTDSTGIVPPRTDTAYTLHYFMFIDWIYKNGKQMLVAQLSSGEKAGHNGLYYFDRETINKAWKGVHYSPEGISLAMYKDESTDKETLIGQQLTLVEVLLELMQRLLARMGVYA